MQFHVTKGTSSNCFHQADQPAPKSSATFSTRRGNAATKPNAPQPVHREQRSARASARRSGLPPALPFRLGDWLAGFGAGSLAVPLEELLTYFQKGIDAEEVEE